jgi:hypothetical protein
MGVKALAPALLEDAMTLAIASYERDVGVGGWVGWCCPKLFTLRSSGPSDPGRPMRPPPPGRHIEGGLLSPSSGFQYISGLGRILFEFEF